MAKVTLPLTASSKLANVELGTEPIGINPFANQGVTAEEAPVLLALESKQTVDAGSFAAKMVKSGGQGTLAQARLFVNAGLSVVEDLVDEFGAVTVQTPMGTIETFVSGTMENAQDQPDPAKNCAFLALVVPETYRKLFAKIETYVPTAVCTAAVKRVRDKATNKKSVCGAKPFYLEGRGMTIGSTGEKLELLNPLTFAKVADVAVDAASKSPIQFLCTLPATAPIAAGPYVLRLTTLAGGAVPWPLDLEVTLLEAVEPTPIAQTPDGICKIYSLTDAASEDGLVYGNTWSGVCVGLKATPSATSYAPASAKLFLGGSVPIPVDMAIVPSADGTSFAVSVPSGTEPPASGVYASANLSLTLVGTAGTEALSLPCKVTVS